jgi:hypothetical protein
MGNYGIRRVEAAEEILENSKYVFLRRKKKEKRRSKLKIKTQTEQNYLTEIKEDLTETKRSADKGNND